MNKTQEIDDILQEIIEILYGLKENEFIYIEYDSNKLQIEKGYIGYWSDHYKTLTTKNAIQVIEKLIEYLNEHEDTFDYFWDDNQQFLEIWKKF